MKKSFIIPLALVGLLTASCNFLNVDDYFEDTFSEERIFESYTTSSAISTVR